jgi:purine-binding chemotaxis protein CheW
MSDVLPVGAPRPPATPTRDPDRAILAVTFQIARQQYALPLDVVREIVRLPALVPLAGAPPTLCGLLNLRGRYLPIMDGGALVGEPIEYDLNSQIVIAGRGLAELGLLTDKVRGVCSVAAEQVVPISRGDAAPFLASVFDLAEESVLVFDLAALLALTHGKARPKAKKRATSGGL